MLFTTCKTGHVYVKMVVASHGAMDIKGVVNKIFTAGVIVKLCVIALECYHLPVCHENTLISRERSHHISR